MSEFKGSAGPWTVRKVEGIGLPGQVGYAIDYNEDQEQVVDYVYEEHDALLIAESPRLLLALIDAELIIREFSVAVPVLKSRADAYADLIAKALGEGQ